MDSRFFAPLGTRAQDGQQPLGSGTRRWVIPVDWGPVFSTELSSDPLMTTETRSPRHKPLGLLLLLFAITLQLAPPRLAAEACLYRSTDPAQSRFTCYTHRGMSTSAFHEECNAILDLSNQRGGTWVLTRQSSCPPNAQAICDGVLGSRLIRHFYGAGNDYLATRERGCKGFGGRWSRAGSR